MHAPSRRILLAGLPAAVLTACTTAEQNDILGAVLGGTGGTGGLTAAEAAAGIRAALNEGTGSAIAQVARTGGYLNDPQIRIPLPPRLADVQTSLARYGLSGILDDLQTQLNRGAEAAAPQARSIFLDAIRTMTITDALGIVRGGPTSATDYFRGRTMPQLVSLFGPPMTRALEQAGAIDTFDRLVARLSAVPLAPQLGADAKQDLIDHGVEEGLDGLFYYVAREEAAIRRDPAERTSEILRRVFG